MDLNSKKVLRYLEAFRSHKVESKEFPKIEPFLRELPSRILQNSPYWKPLSKASTLLATKDSALYQNNENVFYSILSTTLMLNISDVKSVWKHDLCSYFPSTLVTEKEYTLDTFTQILTLYLQLRSWDWVLLKELFHIANDSEHQFHASVEKIVHSFYHSKIMDSLIEHIKKLSMFQCQSFDTVLLANLLVVTNETTQKQSLANTLQTIHQSYFQQFEQQIIIKWNTALLQEVIVVLEVCLQQQQQQSQQSQQHNGFTATQYVTLFQYFSSSSKFPLCQSCLSILSSSSSSTTSHMILNEDHNNSNNNPSLLTIIWKQIDHINNLLFIFGISHLTTLFTTSDDNNDYELRNRFTQSLTTELGINMIEMLLLNSEKQDGLMTKMTASLLFHYWYHYLVIQLTRTKQAEGEDKEDDDEEDGKKWKTIYNSIYCLSSDQNIVIYFQQKLQSIQAIYPLLTSSSSSTAATATQSVKSKEWLVVNGGIEDEQHEQLTNLIYHEIMNAFYGLIQLRFFPIDLNNNKASMYPRYIENRQDLPMMLQILQMLFTKNTLYIENIAEILLASEYNNNDNNGEGGDMIMNGVHPMKEWFDYLLQYTGHLPEYLGQYLVSITSLGSTTTTTTNSTTTEDVQNKEMYTQLWEYLYNTLQNVIIPVQTRVSGDELELVVVEEEEGEEEREEERECGMMEESGRYHLSSPVQLRSSNSKSSNSNKKSKVIIAEQSNSNKSMNVSGRLELQDLNISNINTNSNTNSNSNSFEMTLHENNNTNNDNTNNHPNILRIGSIVRYKLNTTDTDTDTDTDTNNTANTLRKKKMTYLAYANGYSSPDVMTGIVIDCSHSEEEMIGRNEEGKVEYLIQWQNITINWWKLLLLEYLQAYLTISTTTINDNNNDNETTSSTSNHIHSHLIEIYPFYKLFTIFLIQLQSNHLKIHFNLPYLFSTVLLGEILSAYFCVDYLLSYEQYERMLQYEFYPSLLIMYSPDSSYQLLKNVIGISDNTKIQTILRNLYYNYSAQYDVSSLSSSNDGENAMVGGMIGSMMDYHSGNHQLLSIRTGSDINGNQKQIIYLLHWNELWSKIMISMILYDIHLLQIQQQQTITTSSSLLQAINNYEQTLQLLYQSLTLHDYHINECLLLEFYHTLSSSSSGISLYKHNASNNNNRSWYAIWSFLSSLVPIVYQRKINTILSEITTIITCQYAIRTTNHAFHTYQYEHYLYTTATTNATSFATLSGEEMIVSSCENQIRMKLHYYQLFSTRLVTLLSNVFVMNMIDYFYELFVNAYDTMTTASYVITRVNKKDTIEYVLQLLQLFHTILLPRITTSIITATSQPICVLVQPNALARLCNILMQFITTLPSYLLSLIMSNGSHIVEHIETTQSQKKKSWKQLFTATNTISMITSGASVTGLKEKLHAKYPIDFENLLNAHDDHIASSVIGITNSDLTGIFSLTAKSLVVLEQLLVLPLYTSNAKNVSIIQDIFNHILSATLLPSTKNSTSTTSTGLAFGETSMGIVGQTNSLIPFFFNQAAPIISNPKILDGQTPIVEYRMIMGLSSYAIVTLSSFPYKGLLRNVRINSQNVLNRAFAYASSTSPVMSLSPSSLNSSSSNSSVWLSSLPVTTFLTWYERLVALLTIPLKPTATMNRSQIEERISGWKLLLQLASTQPQYFSLLLGHHSSISSTTIDTTSSIMPHLAAYQPILSSPLLQYYISDILPQIEEYYTHQPDLLTACLSLLAHIILQSKRYPIYRNIVIALFTNPVSNKGNEGGMGGKFWDYLFKPLLLDPPTRPTLLANLFELLPVTTGVSSSSGILLTDSGHQEENNMQEDDEKITLNDVYQLPSTFVAANNATVQIPNDVQEDEWVLLSQYYPALTLSLLPSSPPTQSPPLQRSAQAVMIGNMMQEKAQYVSQLTCLQIVLQLLSWERYGSLYELQDIPCAQYTSKYLLQHFYTSQTTKLKFQSTIFRYFLIYSLPLHARDEEGGGKKMDLEEGVQDLCKKYGITLSDLFYDFNETNVTSRNSELISFSTIYQQIRQVVLSSLYYNYSPYTSTPALVTSTYLSGKLHGYLAQLSLLPFHVLHMNSIRIIQQKEIQLFSEWKSFLQLFVLPGSPLRQYYLPVTPAGSTTITSAAAVTTTATTPSTVVTGGDSPILGAMSPFTSQPDASPMSVKESTFQGDKRSYEVIQKLLNSLLPAATTTDKPIGKFSSSSSNNYKQVHYLDKEDEEVLFALYLTSPDSLISSSSSELPKNINVFEWIHLYDKLQLLVSMFHHQLQEVYYKDLYPEDSLIQPRDRQQSRLNYDKLKKFLVKLLVIYSNFASSDSNTLNITGKEKNQELGGLIQCLYPSDNNEDRKKGTKSLLHPKFLYFTSASSSAEEKSMFQALQLKVQMQFLTLFSLIISTLSACSTTTTPKGIVSKSEGLVYLIAQDCFMKLLTVFGMDTLTTSSEQTANLSDTHSVDSCELSIKELQLMFQLSCQLMKITYHTTLSTMNATTVMNGGQSLVPRSLSFLPSENVPTKKPLVNDLTIYTNILSKLYTSTAANTIPFELTNYDARIKNLSSCLLPDYDEQTKQDGQLNTITTSGAVSHSGMHHITTTTSHHISHPWMSLQFLQNPRKPKNSATDEAEKVVSEETHSTYLQYVLQLNDLIIQMLQSTSSSTATAAETNNILPYSQIKEIMKVIMQSTLLRSYQKALIVHSQAQDENGGKLAPVMNKAIMSILMGYSAITGEESLLSRIWQRTLVLLEVILMLLQENQVTNNTSNPEREEIIVFIQQFHRDYEDLLLFPLASIVTTNTMDYPYRYSYQQLQLIQSTIHYLHTLFTTLPNARTYFPKLLSLGKKVTGHYLNQLIPMLIQYETILTWNPSNDSPVALNAQYMSISQCLFAHLLVISPQEKKWCYPTGTLMITGSGANVSTKVPTFAATVTSGGGSKKVSSNTGSTKSEDGLHVRFGENEIFTLPTSSDSATFTSPSGKTTISAANAPSSILKTNKKPFAKEIFAGRIYLQYMEHVLVDTIQSLIMFMKGYLPHPEDYLPLATTNATGYHTTSDYPIGCKVYYLVPRETGERIMLEDGGSQPVIAMKVEEGIVQSVHKPEKKKVSTSNIIVTDIPNKNRSIASSFTPTATANTMMKQDELVAIAEDKTTNMNENEVYLDILLPTGFIDHHTPSHAVLYLLPPLVNFHTTRHLLAQYLHHAHPHYHHHAHHHTTASIVPNLFRATTTDTTTSHVQEDENVIPRLSTGHFVLLLQYLYLSSTYTRLMTTSLPNLPLRGGGGSSNNGITSSTNSNKMNLMKIMIMELWYIIMSCLQHHSYAPLGQESVMIAQLQELASLLVSSNNNTNSNSNNAMQLWNSGNLVYGKDDEDWIVYITRLQDVWEEIYYRLLDRTSIRIMEPIVFAQTKTPRKTRIGLRSKVEWVHTHEDI